MIDFYEIKDDINWCVIGETYTNSDVDVEALHESLEQYPLFIMFNGSFDQTANTMVETGVDNFGNDILDNAIVTSWGKDRVARAWCMWLELRKIEHVET